MPGVLTPQRYGIAKHPEFHWITADGGAGKLNFGTLDEAQNHQALHDGIAAIDLLDDVFSTAFKR